MHYYKRNIGDYSKKAARLSMMQHGAYTLLIDSCYDREQFPTMDDAIDWLWASSKEEIEAVEFVLNKFFILQDDGTYVQNRIKEEIDNYHNNAATNKRIAIERETKRKEEATKRAQIVNEPPRVENEPPPNQEPGTTNQEPPTKENKTKRFVKPTHEELRIYFETKEYDYYYYSATEESNKFLDHFNSNGWKIGGKSPMKDWKAAVRNWIRRGNNNGQAQGKRNSKSTFQELTDKSWANGI